MAQACPPDRCRDAPAEIREVVRTAAERQGSERPRRGAFGALLGRPPVPAATESDFVGAARAAHTRFG